MKNLVMLLFAAGLCMLSCKKLPGNECDSTMPDLKQPVPFKILDSETEIDGNKICTVSEAEFGPEYDEVMSLDPQGTVIYPGAILNFNSIQNGSYIPVVGDRKPIKLSMSLSNISGLNTRDIEEPSLSSVREAIQEILLSKASGGTAAKISWSQKEVYSQEYFRLIVGGNYGNLFFDINANYEYENTEIAGRFLFEFTQEYYSIDMDAPQPGMDQFFASPNNCEQTGGVSPVYVSSVKYGRKVYLLVESKQYGYSHKADIQASFDAFVSSGGVSVNLILQKLMSEKSIKAVIIGGPAYEGVKTAIDIKFLKDYLLNGANFSKDSPGVPLSYTLRFIDDNSVAKLVLYDKFKMRDCQLLPDNCSLEGIKIFEKVSTVSNRPNVELEVPVGYKILGGGAVADCPGTKGVFFTASYPVSTRKWVANAKDHIYPFSTTVKIRVVAIHDPNDNFDVRIFESTGGSGHTPEAQASVGSGYLMTGGGARSNSVDPGNLLTASYPSSANTWAVKSKDHAYPSIGNNTAYAIGIKAKGDCQIETKLFSSISQVSQYPSGNTWVENGWTLCGGGAKANWVSNGSLLTASYPNSLSDWKSSSKDLKYPEQVTLSTYAIGIRLK